MTKDRPLLRAIFYRSRALLWGAVFVAIVTGVVPLEAQSNLDVKGMGFFGNRNLENRLAFLHDLDADEPAELDAAMLEDTAFLLIEQVKRRGYLRPTIVGRFEQEGVDTVHEVRWEEAYSIQLDVGFVADHAVFEVEPGVFFYYESIAVEGVDAISEKELERYFIPGGVLFRGKKARIFTAENFDRRIGRVVRALDEMGYRSARMIGSRTEMDETTGAVHAFVTIAQGPLHLVGEVSVYVDGAETPAETRGLASEAVPLTRDWEQVQIRELRNRAYEAGYPDVRVRLETVDTRETETGELIRDLRFNVERGERVRLTGVRFSADEATRRSVLRRQADLQTGEPLNLLEASEGRRKLMALGIFQEVGMRFDPPTGPEREVVYGLTPSQRQELRLLAGWGSYEQARVGFNWEHRNPWGRANRYEVGGKVSMRSTEGRVTYSIPQFLGTDLTTYINAEYSTRQELNFDQTNRGVAIGTSTFLAEPGIRLALEYAFSEQRADRRADSDFEAEERALVGSINFRASMDRRNDFLAPTSGYNLFASYSIASRWLGGDVDFQKIETGASYHYSLTHSTILHARLRYGMIFSQGDASDNIPFTERFFWGGENSVRGYREGEASPVDARGDQIGSEVYLLGNLELEQRIWDQVSMIVFIDGVTYARDGFFQGANDVLYSVGLGVRYNTAVGPIRLEYGYNPDPRAGDPRGTLHFSIGFPF